MDNAIDLLLSTIHYPLSVLRRFVSVSFLLGMLLVPSLTAAASTTWELTNQQKIEGWNTYGFENVKLIPEGFSIQSSAPGQVVKVSTIDHAVDRVGISYISPTGATGMFFWRPKGMEGNEVFQIPITFQPANTEQTIVLDMGQVKEWEKRNDRIGFAFDGGVDFLLTKMEFSCPRMLDAIVYPLKTFFVFDRARPYSINFLWGPQMTYSADQKLALFTSNPPLGDSWNRVFYVFLGIAFIIALIVKRIRMFFLVFAIIWVIYDLRMGAELISYARTDVQTWWSKPLETKDFRDRGSFLAFTEVVQEFAADTDRYVFVADRGWPYWGTMKYVNWPALPVALDEDTEGIDTWIVYQRSDISLDENRRLSVNGQAISPPGSILFTFEPGAFVFRVDS